MEGVFIAHISRDGIQSCNEHSLNAAGYASENLASVSLPETAYLAGLLHDLGKYTRDFNDYIVASSKGETSTKRIIHSFAGVRYLLAKYHDGADDWALKLTVELIAYAVGSHHGLFDCVDENHENGFIHRLNKQPEYDAKAIGNFLKFGPESQDGIDRRLGKAKEEIRTAVKKITGFRKDNDSYLFHLGLLARLIGSSLIDADRRDTSEFMRGTDKIERIKADSAAWGRCLDSLESKIRHMPMDSVLRKARHEISDFCSSFASKPCGIYRLDVPTGGGKTLSSLRYALRHSIIWNKTRIIYAAPLISILEQNSKVIREAVGDDRLVLEHHSNVIRDEDKDSENRLRYDLLAETWDSPIIVTTLAQLLSSMFAGKTSCVRRFHALANSVMIIDEAQSVPENMLTLFNLALMFLSKVCNATIVLCSATQPCLERLKYGLDVSNEKFIPEDKGLGYREIFRRTRYEIRSCNLDGIAGIVEELLGKQIDSVLVVCNTKKEAVGIFNALRSSGRFDDLRLFHLSASMCMGHREKVLDDMNGCLGRHERIVCVSTQVIEAGVDISFDSVIRFSAGIENIVQCAGRCNRNGESGTLMPVVVVRCLDENLGRLESISNRKNATDDLLIRIGAFSEEHDCDLSSGKAVESYYRILYSGMKSDAFDYPVEGKPTLFSLLSSNSAYCDGACGADAYYLRQAFGDAGREFRIFDDESESILVPYGDEGKELIACLFQERAKHDLAYASDLLERSKKFCVSAYRGQLKRLADEGAVASALDGKVLILNEGWYDNDCGLTALGEDGGGSWSTLIG